MNRPLPAWVLAVLALAAIAWCSVLLATRATWPT